MTAEDVASEVIVQLALRRECRAAGGQSAWARLHGVSRQVVQAVCSGDRPPGARIAAKLGYEQQTIYVRKGRP
jgi:hypothetical protein